MQSLPEPLRPLAEYNQFLLYKIVPKQNGKADKIPMDYRTGRTYEAGSDWQNDPAATAAFNVIAPLASQLQADGVGFLIRDDDPFFFLDIDDCLNGAGWSQVATDVMARLPGAAVEVSQSGRGLHIFGKYRGERIEHGCKNREHGLELYTGGRFAALTGLNAIGSADQDCTPVLPGVVGLYFPRTGAAGVGGVPAEWTVEPDPEWSGPDDDNKLIEIARKSSSAGSAFGNKASFEALWTADVEALSAAFPDKYGGGRAYDGSDADAALATRLAFWTGKNCERIKRIMKQSALVREKWDREDYLNNTILNAVSIQQHVMKGKNREQKADETIIVKPGNDLTVTYGEQILNADGQLEYFEGCVYVQELHRVFTPSGVLLKPEQFNAMYGGYWFDLTYNGKSTRKAFEAFTENHIIKRPKAEVTCFRPMEPPGSLIKQEGITALNVYVPVEVKRTPGDVSPFLSHLCNVLPAEQDRAILLAYMAAVVQHKGVKFQWAPLIQGAPGNGKSLFSRCLAEAVGKRYTHMPRASEIDEKYNTWLFDKIFIGVEDIYTPNNKREVLEILKPMITSEEQERRAMHTDQTMKETCCNFIFNSNYKDAIKKTLDDRRFSVFYCAQQSKADIERDGMGGDYFPDLYDWLKQGGYAVVTDYLYNYPIPCELNPAKSCHRAPETSTTREALYESLGPIEQEILEAIDEGRPGFSNGWISSICLDRLLKEKRKDGQIPVNKRPEMLKGLGYILHPYLPGGRVNVIVTPDAGRPRLFVQPGSEQASITVPAEIARRYQEEQGVIGN